MDALTRLTAVSAGFDTTLAVTSDGTVLAWGGNTFGQLGDGSVGGASSTPVHVDLPAGTHVTAVAAGWWFSLALTSDGRVLAWGSNSIGELGDNSTMDSTRPVFVDLPAGTRITAISAGVDFALALTSDGSVLAWGANYLGQLGDDSTTSSNTPVPVKPPANSDFTAISTGVDYSLALTSDGRIVAWGNNNETGDGIFDEGNVPIPPIELDLPGIRVTSISAGNGGGLALTSDGTVLNWGTEMASSSHGSGYDPVPVDLPAGTRVTAIVAGSDYSLALTTAKSCRRGTR